MKIRLLLALAGLALGFGLPTVAQQKTAPDPQLREAFATLLKKNGRCIRQQRCPCLGRALHRRRGSRNVQRATNLRSGGHPKTF